VSANLGAKVNRRKRAIQFSPNIVKDVSTKGGDKGDGVVVKVVNARKKTKEVTFYKLFLWYPKFLTMVVDNLVLVRMMVDSVGTSRGVEEVGEEIGYRYLQEW